MLNLKYIGGDFKELPVDKTVYISKYTDGKVSFNLKWSSKYAKEYNYKECNFNNSVLEVITDVGTAKFKATEKEYQKFIKMIKNKPESRVNHPAVMLIGIIIVVVAIIYFANGSSTNTSTNNTATNTAQKASKQVVKTTPAKKDFANGDITSSTVKDTLKKAKGTNVIDINSKKEFKSISIIPNGNNKDKTVKIVLKPQIGDETVLAKMAASTIANYSEILSKNKSIDKFILEFDEDFEDEYGKSSEGLAVWMEYSRETMSKIKYDNFKESIYGDYTRAYNIADSYKIATGIYNKLKDFNSLPANK